MQDMEVIIAALSHEHNQYNDIGDECAKALAKALMHENNKLQHLDLVYNEIGPEGAKAFAEALMHKNNKLECMENNPIRREGKVALTRALYHKHCKVTILIGINDWVVSRATQTRRVPKCLLVLLSAREVPRIGTQSAVRRLPSELIRLVGGAVNLTAENEVEEGSSEEEE